MRQAGSMGILAGVALTLFLAGCETFSFPLKSKAVVPPPGQEETAAAAQAPGTQATAPAAAPAAAPVAPPTPAEMNQQVQALEARVQQLESRLAQLEGARPAPPAASGAAATRGKAIASSPPSKTAPAAGSLKPTAGAAEKSYKEGLQLYQSKKYGPAREKFAQYLKNQPQGPKAVEARYHLADSFYQDGKYKEAAVEFNKLATQFPKSILAPAAMLRQALSYKNQQQTQNYQSTLKRLVQAYPQSPEAKEAQKYLK